MASFILKQWCSHGMPSSYFHKECSHVLIPEYLWCGMNLKFEVLWKHCSEHQSNGLHCCGCDAVMVISLWSHGDFTNSIKHLSGRMFDTFLQLKLELFGKHYKHRLLAESFIVIVTHLLNTYCVTLGKEMLEKGYPKISLSHKIASHHVTSRYPFKRTLGSKVSLFEIFFVPFSFSW